MSCAAERLCLILVDKLANNAVFACEVSLPLFHVFAVEVESMREEGTFVMMSALGFFPARSEPLEGYLHFARSQILQLVNRLV